MSNLFIVVLFCILMFLVLIAMFRIFAQSTRVDIETLERAKIYLQREARKREILERAIKIKNCNDRD
jgi:hypothetical protein